MEEHNWSVREPQKEGYKDANKNYVQVHEQNEQEYEGYKGENYEEDEDGYEDDYEDYYNDYEDDYDDYDDDYEDDYEEDYDDNYEDSYDAYDDDYEGYYGDDYEEDYDNNYDDDYEGSDNLMAISAVGLPRNIVRNHPEDLRQHLNNIHKPGKVSDSATMITQNTKETTIQKRRATDPPKSQSKRKVFVAGKRTPNSKRNTPDPLKTEPNLRGRPENEEGLNSAKTKLDALADKTLSESFVVKQPGLRKYFASGQGGHLLKSVEKDHACAIHVEKQDNMRTLSTEAAMKSDSSSGDRDDDKILPAHAMVSSLLGVGKRGAALPHFSKERHLCIDVINGDVTQEETDAIMNIISTEMNMNNAGELSKAILKAGGPQIQQELNQQGNQTAGTAVMTGGGRLGVRHVIHIIPGSSDKQHLQTCLEAGLHLADQSNLHSISIPSVGTGDYGLAAGDSAQVTFQALNSFSGRCQNVRKVRVVVYQAHMMPDFLQEQNRQAVQDVNKQHSGSAYDHSLKIYVTGKNKASVGKAVDTLKKGFFEACTTQEVSNETVSKLSHKQIDTLRRKAKDRDVKLEIEADRIVVRGEATEVTGMVGEIWNEINERNKKIQEEEQVMMVSKNIEWSYEIHGQKMMFDQKTNAKIEMAHMKEQTTVQVPLYGDEFVVDLKAETGRGRRNGETITISRKIKGAEDGIPLPNHWAPMPPSEKTVCKVQLLPGSSEYQDVLRKMQATTGRMNVQKIERVQNPHLYQSYMVRKQKIDKDNGGKSERQLFHGTDGKNISHINAQGFNRSFCGAHGTNYGRGVYFARDASYSVSYAGSRVGARHMYLARVIVGTYCVGTPNMIVPPSKDSSRPEILHDSVVNQMENPSIFVVFSDNQCYPEYLITF